MPERPVAFVTGGAKRVGRAIVERMAAAGYDVAFTYNQSGADAARLVDRLRDRGGRAESIQADFNTPATAQDAVERLLEQFNGVDLLVNCASTYLPDDLPDGATPELQRNLFQVNCIAPSALMTQLAPALRETGGSVVNMLDILADKPWPRYSAYCASKAALQSATLAFARKLAPDIRVNGIAPGVVDWPAEMPEDERASYLARVPLGRAGTPTDVADLVHFLATGAPYVTGQVIRLDGGRSLA